jgi:hypothetical protein
MMVQDRVTKRWYDPEVEFEKLLNDPKTKKIMVRLKDR